MEKLKQYLKKLDKKQQNTKNEQEKSSQYYAIENKWFNIFNIYWYAATNVNGEKELAIAYTKNGQLYDCLTNEFVQQSKFIGSCFRVVTGNKVEICAIEVSENGQIYRMDACGLYDFVDCFGSCNIFLKNIKSFDVGVRVNTVCRLNKANDVIEFKFMNLEDETIEKPNICISHVGVLECITATNDYIKLQEKKKRVARTRTVLISK